MWEALKCILFLFSSFFDSTTVFVLIIFQYKQLLFDIFRGIFVYFLKQHNRMTGGLYGGLSQLIFSLTHHDDVRTIATIHSTGKTRVQTNSSHSLSPSYLYADKQTDTRIITLHGNDSFSTLHFYYIFALKAFFFNSNCCFCTFLLNFFWPFLHSSTHQMVDFF